VLQGTRQLLRAVEFYIELRHGANAAAAVWASIRQIFARVALGYCTLSAVD
jgi:hypothetical protein